MAPMSSSPDWGMHCPDSELFAEYLDLAKKCGWDDLVNTGALTVGREDCLVVVDMQNDFIPVDEKNPKGGAFGVAEGGKIVHTVVKLMEYFAASGALVVATRDYHPVDHCSFIPEGGPFPAHCVQGTEGSKFYPDIALCMANLKTAGRRAEVVFKGFHEDIDSFGSLEYPESYAEKRVTSRKRPERLYGCSSLCSWTGCASLKCSNLANDIDAPPDVLAVHGRVGLSEMLKTGGTKRIFACGLALDFCVLDTCLNAMSCIPSVAEVSLLMDASRAAHIPGLGKVGSGFLSPLEDVGDKLRSSKVVVRPCSTILPRDFMVQSSSLLRQEMIGRVFPEQLGPFAFIRVTGLGLSLDRGKEVWTASRDCPEVESLRKHHVEPSGSISPVFKLTLSAKSLEAIGVPRSAAQFAWAYSTAMGSFDEQSRAYFAITTPESAFFVFGGFVYMDAAGEVVAVMSLSAGSGLGFGQREQLQPEILPALRGRWQPVTVPDMVRRGARKYAWIPPNEEVCAAAGKWKAPPYGCFAYIFHDDEGAEDERDCYFPVAEMSTQGEVRSLNSKIKRDTPAADGAGHFEVTKASLTVFESPDSRRRLGLLRKGDLVFTKGPAKEVAGFTMQPIAPRGAVESKFLRPVGPSGAAIQEGHGRGGAGGPAPGGAGAAAGRSCGAPGGADDCSAAAAAAAASRQGARAADAEVQEPPGAGGQVRRAREGAAAAAPWVTAQARSCASSVCSAPWLRLTRRKHRTLRSQWRAIDERSEDWCTFCAPLGPQKGHESCTFLQPPVCRSPPFTPRPQAGWRSPESWNTCFLFHGAALPPKAGQRSPERWSIRSDRQA